EDGARREAAAGDRVADAETAEVVLEAGGSAGEERAPRGGARLQREVPVGGGRAGVVRREGLDLLEAAQAGLVARVDRLEIGDDRGAVGGEAAAHEEIGIAAG